MVNDPKDLHLFAQPSFMTGVARIFDWRGTLDEYNSSQTPEVADYYALLSDWKAVGNDMWHAIRKFGDASRDTLDEQHFGEQQRS